jgi:hypothetical protein
MEVTTEMDGKNTEDGPDRANSLVEDSKDRLTLEKADENDQDLSDWISRHGGREVHKPVWE